MSQAVIDAACDRIFSRISADASPTVVWHAGEPTTAPLAWYSYAYRKVQSVVPIDAVFSLQTNGIALSNDWIRFLRDSNTRVGLSIDGPERFHDARRKTRSGGKTWSLAMNTLRRLQSAGCTPNMISVLHPSCLSAADEFYEFYRDNQITQVSFSIDEAEGANLTSSFDQCDHKSAMSDFLLQILNRAYSEAYPLYLREVERILRELTGIATEHNEQVDAWQVVVVMANGDVTSFSPEFTELDSLPHNNFRFGNVLRDDFEAMRENKFAKIAQAEIVQGNEICRASCRYFDVCGGGARQTKCRSMVCSPPEKLRFADFLFRQQRMRPFAF